VLIILAVLIIAYSMLTRNAVFGRQVYAIGGNLSAARLSGVKVRKVNFWIFVNMGFLAGVAGVIFSSRSNGAQPAAGQMFELDAIARRSSAVRPSRAASARSSGPSSAA
jgi:putative multiple sugar transport system permease protein